MFRATRHARVLLPALALLLAGCGGASDSAGGDDPEPGASSSPHASANLNLVAYSVPKAAFDQLIPAFQGTDPGQGVTFSPSYGASGDQSRKVESGLAADIVNFSLEPDVTRLVKAGLVDASWKTDAHKGIVANSVVSLVVRKGNPKGIKDWDDIVKDGVEIVTPNALSSGSAKWNLLAPYALKSDGGKNPAAGLDFVKKMVEHIKVQPKSGREATELFEGGTGDVLLSYENEAFLAEKDNPEIEHVVPSTTFKIEIPFAVLSKSTHRDQAEAFQDFLYSTEGQELWVDAGYRSVDSGLAADDDSTRFPTPTKLWTIDDLGGWDKVNADLFDPDKGSIAALLAKTN